MYLRQTRRATRDGTVIRYLQLAQNERHPQTGTPTAKVIFNFGRADDLDLDVLRRLVASVTRYLEQRGESFDAPPALERARDLNDGEPGSDLDETALVEVEDLDLRWVFGQLWRRIVIGADAAPGAPRDAVRSDAAGEVVAALASGESVATFIGELDARAAVPAGDDRWRDALPSVLLAASKDPGSAIFIEMGWRSEAESRRGMTMDVPDDQGNGRGRADREQLVLLAVSRDGVPIESWTIAADAKRKQVVRAVEKEIQSRSGKAPLWLATTADRSHSYAELGRHYVIVDPSVEEMDNVAAIHEEVIGDLRFAPVGSDAAGERLLLCSDPARARAVDAERRGALEALRSELAAAAELPRRRREQRTKELLDASSLPIKVGKHGAVSVDEKAIASLARRDGQALIRSSDSGLSLVGVAEAYRRVLAAQSDLEELNQLLDDTAGLGDAATRGTLSVGALGLRRVVETACGMTWRAVREELSGLRVVTSASAGAIRRSHTAVSTAERQILAALGLSAVINGRDEGAAQAALD